MNEQLTRNLNDIAEECLRVIYMYVSATKLHYQVTTEKE